MAALSRNIQVQPRTGSKSAQGKVVAQIGVVIDVDQDRLIALVKLGEHQVRVRMDTLRGKSAPPQEGETWLFDQPYGLGWQFACPINWSADLDWIAPTAFLNSWNDVGAPNLNAGYRKEVEGWVTLCGKLSGGSTNTTAFVLPVGYRPAGNWTQGGVLVDASGNVKPQGTSPSLDGVRFMAAS